MITEWTLEEKKKWETEYNNGQVFSEENWGLVAQISKKAGPQASHHFTIEFKINKGGESSGARLALHAIPKPSITHLQAVQALKEMQAYVAGAKAMLASQ